MPIEIVQDLNPAQWRNFVDSHPQGNIFHTPEMFQVFSRIQKYSPSLWAAVDEKRGILAIFSSVQITLLDGVLAKFTTHAVAYGSVLWTPGPEGEEALEMLVQACQKKIKRNVLFTELRNLSNLEAIQPFLRKHNFEYQDHLNYLIELQNSPEAMFQNIGQRTRKNIKRGLKKSEVVIKEATGQKHVDICYELLRQTYRAAGIPLADSSLFQAAFDLLYPKGMIKFTLAYVGENPVAISVELLYKDVIYGWYGGMDRAYSSYVPNELLMWHILRWGAKNGYRLYDFGGCWKP